MSGGGWSLQTVWAWHLLIHEGLVGPNEHCPCCYPERWTVGPDGQLTPKVEVVR